MLIDLLKNKYTEPLRIKITLCKSDFARTPLFELSEAYGESITPRFADIDEINFKIPYYLMRNGKQIENPKFDLIKGDMFLLVEILDEQQYFVIKQASLEGSEKQYKEIKAYSLEYTFSDKSIRGYTGTKRLYDILNPENGVLNYVISQFPYWSIDYVNPDLLDRYRTFDVSEQNMWDFIRDLQGTFECVLLFDTVNKTIRAEKLENIGQNKGLIINQDNYIKHINVKPNYDEIVTRLHVYGQDNLSINSVNPTGSSYIETYEYYKINDFMSQSLINALNDYEDLVEIKTGEFNILLGELNTLYDELQDLYINSSTGLNKLQLDLAQIRDQIYTAIETNTQPNFNNSVLQAQENSKLNEIDVKNIEIDNKNTEITDKILEITDLKNLLAIENNFTLEQIKEWSVFWKEKTWQDNNYFDVDELYEDGKDYLLKMAQPALQFKIDSVCFLKTLSEQVNWDKIVYGLGDFINVEYDKFGIQLEVRLVSYTYDFDNGSLDLEFSNKSSIDDPLVYLYDLMKSSITTSTTVNIERFKYGKYNEERNTIIDYINDELDLAKQKAFAGRDEDITIDERGIILKNDTNPNDIVRILSNVMVFSDDGMNTVKTAISANGIVANNLFGKVIAGANLIIENSGGTFSVDADGVTISNMDLTLVGNDDKNRILMNGDIGIKIQQDVGGTWTDKFFVDVDGNLKFSGDFVAGTITIGSGNNVFKADSNGIYLGNSTFASAPFRVTPAGVLTATNATITGTINATGGTLGDLTVTGTLTGGTISGSTIIGGSINVTTNVYVGNNIYVGNPSNFANKGLYFYDGGTNHIGIFMNQYGSNDYSLLIQNRDDRIEINSESTILIGNYGLGTYLSIEPTEGYFVLFSGSSYNSHIKHGGTGNLWFQHEGTGVLKIESVNNMSIESTSGITYILGTVWLGAATYLGSASTSNKVLKKSEIESLIGSAISAHVSAYH